MHELELMIQQQFHELQIIMQSIELDILKCSKGNMTAGIRARKGLRMIKRCANDLLSTSIEHAKEIRNNKKINS